MTAKIIKLYRFCVVRSIFIDHGCFSSYIIIGNVIGPTTFRIKTILNYSMIVSYGMFKLRNNSWRLHFIFVLPWAGRVCHLVLLPSDSAW